MSTRCYIGKRDENNKVRFIYCHHDGYPDGVGTTLKEFYDTDEKIDAMIALGNRSALCELPKVATYSGDYGEPFENNKPTEVSYNEWVSLIDPDKGIDYFYLFSDGEWKCLNRMGIEWDIP